MGVKTEDIEKNKVKLTFTVGPERFEEGMRHAYNKNKGRINLPGFRKGKAPRKIIEMQFGKEFLYDDAINFVLQDAYEEAAQTLTRQAVSRPTIDVEEVSTENGVVFVAEVYVKPEMDIDGYKGITYGPKSEEVTDEEIDAEINKAREKNARTITVTDRPVQEGDIVTIDFEGFMDGVPFEGGLGKDYELTIGSHTFIDTFEEQLVGASVGDDLDVIVSFPENYGKEEFSGKPALFKVEVKDIQVKELPEADDDFAQDVSEFDTLDEYKADIRNKLAETKKSQAEHDKENQVMDKLIALLNGEIPEVMVDGRVDSMYQDMGNQLRRQGIDMETYFNFTGETQESIMERQRPTAEAQVKGRLALETVAQKEGLTASDEELDEEMQRMAESYGMDKEKLSSVMGDKDKQALKEDVLVQKALKFVLENAVAEA